MDLPSHQVYLGIVAILAFIGWAGLARVIRGLVLSMRKSDYVTAAEALGFGRLRVIARHVLPNTMSYVIVAATLSIPGYILGEVMLSFLGVGVQEPSASWGNMLQPGAQHSRADVVPVAAVRARHGHLPDRDGVQLPRRRPARRARPAQGERRTSMSDEPAASPRESQGVFLHRYGRHSRGRWRVVRGQCRARRWRSSASRAAARASRRSRS